MDNLIIVNEDHQLAYEVKNNIEFNKKILKTISEKNYHLKFKITFTITRTFF